MSIINKNNLGDSVALSDYIDAATQHGLATEEGNSDAANVAYDRLCGLLERNFSGESRRLLVPAMDHENLSVRVFAALHTYLLDRMRSERVLEAAAKAPGLVGFSAAMTLRELKSGGLVPP